jgi:S1-C subfamily serine protease
MAVRKVVPAVTGAAEPVEAPRFTLSGTTDYSGGPLVDREARLVGVVAGTATGPGDRNVTRAIDMAEVRAFLADKHSEPPAPPTVTVHREPPPRPI